MQVILIPLPETASKLIPHPTTNVGYRPHDFRRAGLNAAAVWGCQKAEFDPAITKRDSKVPAGNVSILQNLCVTARLGHRDQNSTSVSKSLKRTRVGPRDGDPVRGFAGHPAALYCNACAAFQHDQRTAGAPAFDGGGGGAGGSGAFPSSPNTNSRGGLSILASFGPTVPAGRPAPPRQAPHPSPSLS